MSDPAPVEPEPTPPSEGIFTGPFIKETLERAIKTAAQALVAIIGTKALTDIDLTGALSVTATAFVLSILTCIVSAPFGPKGTPSLVK